MKKPKLSKLVPKRRAKRQNADESAPVSSVQPITNETVAAHREEVLSSARKYIYPLQHSKHKIVLISTTIFVAAFIGFFTYCMLALYRFKSNSSFLYGVTQVVPFPVARVGSHFVAYENYLFELRHYVHFYELQQKVDFDTLEGKQQLAEYKKRALQKVVDDAYIKQLAAKHKITVTGKELDNEIALVRSQNRLGANEKGFEDVLKNNFGWSVSDFKRSLRQEMLAQKVVAKLDTVTQQRAQIALAELQNGASFADVAKKYSDDPSTKDNGGEFSFLIDKSNRDLTARLTGELFKLQPNQTSQIINTGYGLEIIKNLETQGDKIRGAHILFRFMDINTYLNELKEKQKAQVYIKP